MGIPELRKILDSARQRININNTQTILLIDEIHHFNRTQQDALLPDVESGDISIGVYQLNGTAAGQSVFHYHMHLIPRTEGQRRGLHGRSPADDVKQAALAARLAAALE